MNVVQVLSFVIVCVSSTSGNQEKIKSPTNAQRTKSTKCLLVSLSSLLDSFCISDMGYQVHLAVVADIGDSTPSVSASYADGAPKTAFVIGEVLVPGALYAECSGR
jgi:hypothetical protein